MGGLPSLLLILIDLTQVMQCEPERRELFTDRMEHLQSEHCCHALTEWTVGQPFTDRRRSVHEVNAATHLRSEQSGEHTNVGLAHTR